MCNRDFCFENDCYMGKFRVLKNFVNMYEEKANEEMQKGENLLKSFMIFGNKYEYAVEHFKKAANLYKMGKEWEKAGNSWKMSFECFSNLKSRHEAANSLFEASKCYKKVNINEAIKALLLAINYYLEDGNFTTAARHKKKVAEMYENLGDIENAIIQYEQAGDLYDGENITYLSNACKIKVGIHSAQIGNLEKAVKMYEYVAFASLENSILKWCTKEYFLCAGICHLCLDDIISSKRALEKYKDLDINFETQRECVFLESIMDACEKYNVEAFTKTVREYDNISKLDSLKINLLLIIKNNINNEDDLM